MDDALRARWNAVTAPLGIDGREAERVLDDLARRHAEDHRAYHTLAHVRHVLDVLDFLDGREPVDDPLAVRLAAWFHDAVYAPGAPDNEERSAKLAAEVLTDWQVVPERVGHIHRLVLVTADHQPATGDEAVLVDADLAILAADPHTYSVYTRAIRVEYAHLDDRVWRQGRASFLHTLLARDAVFTTATMRRRGEDVARRNLAGELAKLEPS